jgi:peptidoglycan/LPS O-acetylase OafA/YrhL
MATPLITVALVLLGFVVGAVLNAIMRFAQGKKLDESFGAPFAPTWETFIAEIFYFACLLSIPLSGNIPLFVLVIGILIYSLYGGYAADKLKPKKPEDKVPTKWFSGFP